MNIKKDEKWLVLLANFIEAMFWAAIFISPVTLLGIIGLMLYLKFDLPWAFIASLALGCFLGTIIAERIRKKTGCSTFFSFLIRTRS
jgi:hypothetical protein